MNLLFIMLYLRKLYKIMSLNMKPRFSFLALLLVTILTAVCFAATPDLITPSTRNVGANMATLALHSSETGTGYFTLRSGSNANCGDGNKVAFGPYSSGSYHGSLPLFANVSGNYTVRNLTEHTAYTLCFTADSPSGSNLNPTPAFTNISTHSAKTFTSPGWSGVGAAGFSAGTASLTSLAFAPDGTPYVVYSDSDNLGKATVMKFSGGAWSLVGDTGFSAGAISSASLAFAPDGTPYLAYQDGGNSFKATVMKYNGSSWGLVGSAGFTTDMVDFTSLAFGPDGSPYLAYSDYADFGKMTVKKFSSGSWTNVGIPGFSSGEVYYVSLAFAPDGTPYLAYLDGGIGYKATVMKYTGTAWSVVGSAGFSDGFVTCISLTFAPNGTPYVAYVDHYNSYKTTVMKYSGSAWSLVGDAGFSAGQADYTSMAITPDSTLYLAYSDYGGTSSGKVTLMKSTGSAWSLAGNAGFSAGAATSTSLAIAPDGSPYVAYGDEGHSSKATVMKLINLVPTISGTPDAIASLGNDYFFEPTTTNAISFSGENLPPGLSVNPDTGVLSGKPTTINPIPYNCKIIATNDVGSAELSFTITVSDVTIPDTAITTFPANPTSSASFSFNFTANPASGASFECSLNGGPFASCSNPYSDNFSYTSCSTCRTETARNLAVKASNQAGTDDTPDSFAWTINHLLGTPFDYVNGGGEVQLRAIDHSGDLNINRPGIAFSLKGGYNPDYTSNSGLTNIQGTFTILYGTVIIENIVIK
jgi:hypothetical protein